MRGRHRALLDQLWRERLHTDPQVLTLSLPAVREAFASIWEPALLLKSLLNPLPGGLLALWLAQQGGHIVVSHAPSHYESGRESWRNQELAAVGTVCAADLAAAPQQALYPVAHLIDHLLGSHLSEGGRWFSDGTGATPRLAEQASRFAEAYRLSYATPTGLDESPRAYWARILSLYLVSPTELNTIDPLGYRLLQGTLLADRWWPPLH
ncbi:MAG: hypothetical protein ACOX2L_07775 [Anaerolineae bacterium]|jgi:hypothetical protein|nr:hypothetical protein [Chloroflexota bacterium]